MTDGQIKETTCLEEEDGTCDLGTSEIGSSEQTELMLLCVSPIMICKSVILTRANQIERKTSLLPLQQLPYSQAQARSSLRNRELWVVVDEELPRPDPSVPTLRAIEAILSSSSARTYD